MKSKNYFVDDFGTHWDRCDRIEYLEEQRKTLVKSLRLAVKRAEHAADFRGAHDVADMISALAHRSQDSVRAMQDILYRAEWCRAWGKPWSEFPG